MHLRADGEALEEALGVVLGEALGEALGKTALLIPFRFNNFGKSTQVLTNSSRNRDACLSLSIHRLIALCQTMWCTD